MKDIAQSRAPARVEEVLEGSERFKRFVVDVIYGRRSGGWADVLGGVLLGLSAVFRLVVKVRTRLYQWRIFRDQALGCLVVVVGNLTVGGTGKTPVVEIFARTLAERGRKVAILSRGYKSRAEPAYRRLLRWITHASPPPPKIVSDGRGSILGPQEAGDEPYMLARNLPGVVILTDKNRVKAGLFAIKHFGCDTLVLDDGFQYLPLKGRLNLLLVDKTNPFGNRQLLPRGVLREPVSHLRRASYVFLTKSDGKPDPALEAEIRHHQPTAEIIECTHRPRHLVDFVSGERLPLEKLAGARVAAFSGIAVPESFEEQVRALGAQILYNHRFLDHHWFASGELETLFRNAAFSEADCVVTTEKDAVRIPTACRPEIPFYYLRMEIEILSGAEDFEEAVSRICFPKNEMRTTRAPFRSRVGAA